jgi:hypothetical protein
MEEHPDHILNTLFLSSFVVVSVNVCCAFLSGKNQRLLDGLVVFYLFIVRMVVILQNQFYDF